MPAVLYVLSLIYVDVKKNYCHENIIRIKSKQKHVYWGLPVNKSINQNGPKKAQINK